jgi:hypothetical protein
MRIWYLVAGAIVLVLAGLFYLLQRRERRRDETEREALREAFIDAANAAGKPLEPDKP